MKITCNICNKEKDEEEFELLTENQVVPRRCYFCKECGKIRQQKFIIFERAVKELRKLIFD